MEKYYITTAIAYTSGKPHIGNTYEAILGDSIARYKRLQGFDVYFQTGTDEHGQKIQNKAQSFGKNPQEFVNEVAKEVKKIWDIMNVSYDNFVRTTDKVHVEKVQQIFKKLYDQGDIYKGKYEGLYCTPCESFFTESQAVEGYCPDCGCKLEITSEEAYFLKLSKYTDKLIKHIEENPEFLQPESRKNEIINNFIKPGLQDLCVSRSSFNWGIPVSFDDKHVIYVWIDALSNYITFLGYNVDEKFTDMYKKFWPADLHLIGKDIFRFHAIYWPIMLMALNQELPKKIFGHPWLLTGNGKMSKSKGNVMYADELVDLFGVDAVRYFVLHETPYANDGTISYDLIIERTNSDLVNTLGNLVNRTISMTTQYFDGVIENCNINDKNDDELIKLALKTPITINNYMDNIQVSASLEAIMELARRCNKYIDETAPWILAKDKANEKRLKTILYNLLESIRFIAVLLQPFLPDTANKIFLQLNTNEKSMESLKKFGNLKNNTKLNTPEHLFVRIDKEEKLNQISKKLEEK